VQYGPAAQPQTLRPSRMADRIARRSTKLAGRPIQKIPVPDLIHLPRAIAVRNDARVWHTNAKRVLTLLDIARILFRRPRSECVPRPLRDEGRASRQPPKLPAPAPASRTKLPSLKNPRPSTILACVTISGLSRAGQYPQLSRRRGTSAGRYLHPLPCPSRSFNQRLLAGRGPSLSRV
jgi:hypothetical protein